MVLSSKTIPFRTKNLYKICDCERCGEPLVAYERDARELATIFAFYIKRENMWLTKLKNMWLTKLKKTVIHSLGGHI